MIQVTITCDTLDELANYLRLGAAPVASANKKVQKEVAAEAVLQSASTGGSTVAEEETETETDMPVTIEQIRALVKAKTDAGKREECKALIKEFGAANVTTLKAEHYSDFFTRLNTI